MTQFNVGKLYKLKRPMDDDGIPFRAGDLAKSFVTASGETDYTVLDVHDGAILLFMGEKTLSLRSNERHEVYLFLYSERLIIFKKKEADAGFLFARLAVK